MSSARLAAMSFGERLAHVDTDQSDSVTGAIDAIANDIRIAISSLEGRDYDAMLPFNVNLLLRSVMKLEAVAAEIRRCSMPEEAPSGRHAVVLPLRPTPSFSDSQAEEVEDE